jgi:hypothetical protein
MSCLDRRLPSLSSTTARMVGLTLLTSPEGAYRGYENSAPRTTTAARVPSRCQAPSVSSVYPCAFNSSAVMSSALENEEPGVGRISSKHRGCIPNPALFAGWSRRVRSRDLGHARTTSP